MANFAHARRPYRMLVYLKDNLSALQATSTKPYAVDTHIYVQSTLPDFPTRARFTGLKIFQSRRQKQWNLEELQLHPQKEQTGLRCRGSVGFLHLHPIMLGMYYR